MTEIKRRNNRKRGGRKPKKFDWSGVQHKPSNLPVNKNGIPIMTDRSPRTQVFPGQD